jgi:FAD/FMN-containing dehydrogenase
MTVLDDLTARLGADVIAAPEAFDPEPYLADFLMHADKGARILALARPRTTADVAAVLEICTAAGAKVTVQGGRTGFAGGAVPEGESVVLSLERMNAIEEVDVAAGTMTVQAGAPLQAVQEAAEAAGQFFALDLGGRGSAQIGGNAATNAGGNRVVRYGMMRALVLGAEWVLADGTVVTALNKMIKNNAGYDLKHLMIGSEGTLGVITRLVLRLHPKPQGTCTALLGLKDYDAVLAFLAAARAGLGATLSAFEIMWPPFYRLGTEALGRRAPLPFDHGVYLLVETLGDDPSGDAACFERVIGQAMEVGSVDDAVIASSARETAELWAIRDCPGEFKQVFWPQISFDVSIPTGEMAGFMDLCRSRLEAKWPGVETVFFGHVADSNLHLSVKTDGDPVHEHEIDAEVYACVGEWGGSVSAEHGIGSHKKAFLHHSRTPPELAMMRALKAALDPKGTLNPGKVFD